MSTALEACHEWQNENRDLMWTLEGRDRDEALFLAGYRRALEDAADEYDRRADRDKDAIGARANVAIVCRDHAAELRAMAAGVGTKDGDDDE